MAIKSFNIDPETYIKFNLFCKDRGISMSKQVEIFMKSVVDEPKVRKEYLKKIKRLQKEPTIPVDDFAKRYGLK